MKIKKLNAGIIGLGVGERHITGYRLDKRCDIKKLCDFDREKISVLSKKYPEYEFSTDPNQILNDPEIDVVSIASYDNFHADQVIKAIQNGKHVFVEKPICLHENELKSIVKVLNNNPHCKLSSNFVLRKSPQFLVIKKEIEENKFGDLYSLEGDYNYGRIHKLTNGWRGDIPFYSVMHGGGIHIIDLLMWISKKKVIEVIGISSKIVTENTKFKFPDIVSALLRFEDNVIGKITANFGSVTPHHHKLAIYGTQATFFNSHETGIIYKERENSENKLLFKHSFDNYKKTNVLTSFISSLIDNTQSEVTCKEVIDVMSISLAIEKSLFTKRWEKVNYLEIEI